MDNVELDPPPTEELAQIEVPARLFDFNEAKVQIDQIIGSWTEDCREAEMRRNQRYVELDVESLRQSGEIGEDETFIPDRVIDGNIKRDNSENMAFLNAGNRLAIFKCKSNPNIDTRLLEQEVTDGLTYSGWYKPFLKVSDGAALHKADHIEVVFDPTKPLHVGFEHIGYDCLFFNRNVEEPKDSEWLVRLYEMSPSKFEEADKSLGFDPIQVDNIIKARENTQRFVNIPVYKLYFKYEGKVFISWYCNKSGVQDWLKKPEPLRLGIFEKDIEGKWIESDITDFPIFTNTYCEDEQRCIVDKKGRGFLDSPQQECNTAIMTAYTNGAIKASFVYSSPKADDTDSSELKQLDIHLTADGIYNKPLEFWSKPAPEVSMLQALSIIDTKNATQQGKTGFAANNRKDSRKTAKELEFAQQAETKITSTILASFSEFLRGLFEFSWAIIRSQALQDKVKLLLTPIVDDPNLPDQIRWVNNYEVIEQEYDIRPAGNTDIIEAQEEQQKMMQDWPVVQTTPLKNDFLMDYIKIRYPKNADRYNKILAQSGLLMQLQQAKQLVPALTTLLQTALSPEELKAMTPDEQHQVQQIQQQAQAFSQQPI